ncbi:MAG: tRNA pseudouridine synthase A [Phycisphaeraceae bacterium]|nr:tRNA pseudouridine synthase A [Phycisphaeraceae bacterium]
MPRYRLTIAYEGTEFHGWQKQEPPDPAITPGAAPVPPGSATRDGRAVLRTVQEIVERAVREVVREPVYLVGASRTDAGVHARAQVAAFTCSGDATTTEDAGEPVPTSSSRARSGWPVSRGLERLRLAINARLPEDALVTAIEPVPDSFDPISHAREKAYSYTILCSPHRPLWERRWVFHSWRSLDPELMHRAARHFVGEHDFAALAAAGHGRASTVRTIFDCRVTTLGRLQAALPSLPDAAPTDAFPPTILRIDVSGNGFLYNMVRIIAGTLHEVGRRKLDPDAIPEILASCDRRRAGPTLPPEGLCLEWIRYDQPDDTTNEQRLADTTPTP